MEHTATAMNLFLWLPVILLVGFCLYVVWTAVSNLRRLNAQLAAYRRGEYEEQLRIIEGFRSQEALATAFLFFRGVALFELGRLEEAEQSLRESLSKEKVDARKTLCRDQLGLVLIEQCRWDEAAECFRECIAGDPKRGGGYRGMAELLLRRGGQDGAALDSARLAVTADREQSVARGELGREEHALNLSESLAILAWALARNAGDPAEVEGVLREAFEVCGEGAKPIVARLYYCAGQAYASLGRTIDSARQFERATATDPAGNYGRLSRAAT